MANEEKVPVKVVLSAQVVERIDELAKLLGGSRSGVCAALVESALQDEEWIIRHISVPIRRILKRWGASKALKALGTESAS